MTKLIPFFSVYQQYPQNNFKYPEEADPKSNNPKAVKMVKTLEAM